MEVRSVDFQCLQNPVRLIRTRKLGAGLYFRALDALKCFRDLLAGLLYYKSHVVTSLLPGHSLQSLKWKFCSSSDIAAFVSCQKCSTAFKD